MTIAEIKSAKMTKSEIDSEIASTEVAIENEKSNTYREYLIDKMYALINKKRAQ